MDFNGKLGFVSHDDPMDYHDKLVPEIGERISKDGSAKESPFDPYAHYSIHEEMLKDKVRSHAFKDAFMLNENLIRGKVVMDVGCGTGVFSMFAARAGAKKVYAIDCSDIAKSARAIIKANELDHVITVIQAKIEDLKLPDGCQQVDVIVSAWMGFCLLYDSMMEQFIFARDKWLAPDGILLPDRASLNICAIDDHKYKEEKVTCTSVYSQLLSGNGPTKLF